MPLNHKQQARLIDIIYINQEIFSLHDESIRFCEQRFHFIPVTTQKLVYLPHHMIPCQFWEPGFIKVPSNHPKVLMLQKSSLLGKSGLCTDNKDSSFTLPHINETSQAVHNNQYFISF